MVTTVRETNWGRRFRWFLAISLLLHFLFFAGYGAVTHFQLFRVPEARKQQEDMIVFKVVENQAPPEKAPPPKARYASDRNARAKNQQRTPKKADLPFQSGTVAAPVPRQAAPEAVRQPSVPPAGAKAPQPKQQPAKQLAYLPPPKSFSRDVLLGRPARPAAPPERSRPAVDNRKFSVDDLGGFAFNTYDWNFAPYLLYLKRRIEKNIFPPPAFTRMGIIEGRAVVRFVISKDGKLLSLRVLDSRGHHSLTETSVNAVEVSAPFRPLPSDFPEEVLEVTGTFIYKVYR